jgi:hypothetical protein
LVDSFTVSIGGTEYDLGALSPTTGTTYQVALPPGVPTGAAQAVVVYAVNENGRSESIEVTITW